MINFRSRKKLAYLKKKGNKIHQLDSWMQDVNGDTRLDLIQKQRVIKPDGSIQKESTKVFLRTSKGKFKRDRKVKLNSKDYIMESIF